MSEGDDAKPVRSLININAGEVLGQISDAGWAKELGRMLESLFGMPADGLALRRQARLRRLEEKFERELEASGTSRRQLDDALTTEVMLGASTTDDDNLLTLWARLLTSAHAGLPIDAFLASLVRQLDPACAAIVQCIGDDFERDRTSQIEKTTEQLNELGPTADASTRLKLEKDLERLRTRTLKGWKVSRSEIASRVDLQAGPEDVREALERLTALGLFDQLMDAVANADGYGDEDFEHVEVEVEVDVFYGDKLSATRLGARLWSALQPRPPAV